MQFLVRIFQGKNPILTQCVQASNVERYRPAVVENIIRKLNTKLGGVNHMVRVGCLNIFDMPILIIGADVTHPQAGSKVCSAASVLPYSVNRLSSTANDVLCIMIDPKYCCCDCFN